MRGELSRAIEHQGKRCARETYLVCDVWSRICDVPARLCEDALVVVAIEQRVLDISLLPVPIPALSTSRRAHAVRLETCLLEDHEQSPLARRALWHDRLNWEHMRIRDDRDRVAWHARARLVQLVVCLLRLLSVHGRRLRRRRQLLCRCSSVLTVAVIGIEHLARLARRQGPRRPILGRNPRVGGGLHGGR